MKGEMRKLKRRLRYKHDSMRGVKDRKENGPQKDRKNSICVAMNKKYKADEAAKIA